MSNRNRQDALLNVSRALPTADGTVTSGDIDLGNVKPGVALDGVELGIDMPALTSTHLPSADTITITVQGGATATPTDSLGLTAVITGTGSAIAAQSLRFRLPPNCPRFINAKFVAAGGTGDISGVSAVVGLRF